MSKIKKYIIACIVVLLTLLYVAFNAEVFIHGGETDYLKIVYTAMLSMLICGSIFFDSSMIDDSVKAVASFIMFMLTPLVILFGVMNNLHIAMLRLFAMNYLLIYAAMLVLMSVFGRYSVGIILTTAICFFVLALNTEITIFRGTPIVPTDIFAIGTALSVSSNYKPVLTYEIFSSAQVAVLWCIIAFKFNFRILKTGWKREIVAFLFVFCFVAVLFWGIGNYFDKHNPDTLHYDKYDTALSNKKFGTFLTFFVNTKKMIIGSPNGYSKTAASDILKGYTAEEINSNIKPHIVVIMDEAFSDLSGVYNMQTSDEVLPNFNALKENTVRGNMLASVFGGNTCVTEFEFLTGITDGILNEDTNAFVQCVSKPVHSLCYDLKDLGYTNIAIHPFWQNSWRRKEVYPLLGFDKCIFAENFGTGIEARSDRMRSKPVFGDYDYVRGYLSDKDDFEKIKEQFENKKDGEKLFVFNVTIQNHGGYTYEGKDFENTITSSVNNDEVDQYLTLANKSDKAIDELIDYFKAYDEPVAVVVFGDHQPNLSFERNVKEEFEYLGKDSRYIVPFAIWTNYDSEEKQVDIISPAYLNLLVKESCGIEKNSWDKFREEMYHKYPALTLKTAYNSNKEKLDKETISESTYDKYKIVEYGLLFDKVTP